ncbi:MAG: nucleotide exchange factor GrpE [Erysipelotrichia bacterium]|nr:nucleotide exchange factor GrpE [Erysipelotrichia bacterium]
MVKTKITNNNISAGKIVALEQKAAELEDRLKRSLADYVNLEKRIDSQRQLFVTLATVSIITKMIEVLDDLYLTYNHLQDEGLKMTIDKFVNILRSEGVEEILAENQEFDPQTMDCTEVIDGPVSPFKTGSAVKYSAIILPYIYSPPNNT